MFKATIRLLILPALAIFVLGVAPSSAADASFKIRMTEPFEVNGQLFATGTLTVKEVGAYSPVATLNQVCVDRDCLGVLIATELPGASTATENELIFARSAAGHLVLEGLAARGDQPRELLAYRADEGGWLAPTPRVTEPAPELIVRSR